MSKPRTKTVKLDEIVIDRSVNPREQINEEHVEDLVNAIKRDEQLPLPVCYDVAGKLKLAEGFHRYTAYQRLRKLRIDVTVIAGTDDDWALAALCSNQGHGLKRSNAEKRLAVEGMLKRFPDWSSRRIADAAGVGDDLVNKTRHQVSFNDTCDERKGADGKTYTLPKPKSNKPVTSNDIGEQENDTATKIDQTNRTSVSSTASEVPLEEAVNSEVADVPESSPEPVSLPEIVDKDQGTDEQLAGGTIVEQAESVCRQLDQIKKQINGWKDMHGGRQFHFPTLIGYLDSLRSDIWQMRPNHTCPYCQGNKLDYRDASKPCTGCKAEGIVCKAVHTQGKASMDKYRSK